MLSDEDRWVAVGGKFETELEAHRKMIEYKLCGTKKRPKIFRVVRF